MRRPLPFGLVAVAVLCAAAVALAADPTREKIALTAAGNAQARAEVLRRTDLGAGWSGGRKKPDLSSKLPCSYRPKQSDLVVVGAAETDWHKPGLVLSSVAQVLRTAAMVRRDWRRTVVAPQVVPCLREGFVKSLGSKGELVSFRRVAFPRVATYTRAFQAIVRANTPLGPVLAESDLAVLGAGRNETTVVVSGPRAAKARLRAQSIRLARLLADRMQG